MANFQEQDRRYLGYFAIWLFTIVLVLQFKEVAQAQCDEDCAPTGPKPSLVIPELLPAPEVQPAPLYAETAIYAPDGKIVSFQYLQSHEVIASAPIILIDELVLPLGQEYLPITVRGYFKGHRAWDLTYRQIPEGETVVHVQPPHPNAILLAAFVDIPLGQIAERIQSSGSVEVFYVNLDTGDTIKPYLISLAHLETKSVAAAVIEAGENEGVLTTAGIMGNTGLTDGLHIHITITDLMFLYAHFGTDNPIAAYGNFVNLDNPVTADLAKNIFLDPSLFFPQLRPSRSIRMVANS